MMFRQYSLVTCHIIIIYNSILMTSCFNTVPMHHTMRSTISPVPMHHPMRSTISPYTVNVPPIFAVLDTKQTTYYDKDNTDPKQRYHHSMPLVLKKWNENLTIINENRISQKLSKVLSSLLLCLVIQATPFIQPAIASNYYGTLSDEQKVVAEAWRLIDNSFLDRTFNGLDWFQIRTNYVKNTKYKTADDAQNAIGEMTNLLGDKYTRYLSPAKYRSIVDSATGTLAGTGIEISMNKKTGRIYASDIQENSPAKQAGIQIGDIFVEVDGVRFIDDITATPDDVAVKLRGPKGSKVGVVMERNDKVLDYILTREPITITSVRSYMSSMSSIGNVGIIRIKSFSGTTSQIVNDKYLELKKQGAQAYIIDVRSNPGGLLPGGVDTAALFLDVNKPIVFVVNKAGIVDSQISLGQGIDIESPLIILVDSNTASAAEVFTAALQENKRAIVVGETTFGKGIVQTIRELSNGNYGGLAITVARYETPLHHDINKQGIPVDVISNIDCPKDNAILCIDKTPVSTIFRKPMNDINEA